MDQNVSESTFRQEVENKYIVYNSLFANLPYHDMGKLGALTPMLYDLANEELNKEKNPKDIIEFFLNKYAYLNKEEDKNELLFRIIQFIERQVVLFDSVEDASFDKIIAVNHQNGTLENLYQVAQQQNKLKEVYEELKTFKVRVVFTAHPTQFYPNTVLRIISDLTEAIQDNDITQINNLLQQLGRTPFINKNKLTPLEEANSIIYYLRYVYYDAIGQLHEKLFSEYYSENKDFIPIMELGFWPGGDRDGNPYVTSSITKKVTQELRTSIMKCYYNDLKKISRRLTFRGVYEKLRELSQLIYDNSFGVKKGLTTEIILEKALEIRRILVDDHDGIFLNELDRFIRQVQTFRMHFASLDIRQDSSIHQKILNAIVKRYNLSEKSYDEMDKEEKFYVLFQSNILIQESDFEEDIIKDTIRNIKQIKQIQEENGVHAIHRYIISNSTSIFSVLEVFALFEFCGYKKEDIELDIIPLFETVEGLDNAESIMQQLYNLPLYREHLMRREKRQTIMLGFSDGTKDGGYVKANWAIFKAKEELTKVSKDNEIEVLFFDGRGGPPARGGGKTRQFYASQGPTIASNQIQLTIQGQTISSSYGSINQAKHNFEQLITAGISNRVFENKQLILSPKDRYILDELSKISYKKYEELKEHPQFIAYLEERTTVEYYGKANIGSRPSKRKKDSSGLQFKDLRAIPFVGAWSQAKQNVPGYFGFGTAIQEFKEQGRLSELQDLYEHSLYFRTLVQNSMMSMIKCNFKLTSYMKDNDKFSDFWNILNEEFKLTYDLLLEVSKQKVLMEKEEINRMSVLCREKIMLPLLVIQQFALQKINETENDEERIVYERMLVRTLFGIINASRNSA
ncbi:phosphoenolpyruvate carboxylase [Apibacter muscae]|uniref:Phosphoenolpyruvate carboxylase n=1 Tax=Apibacter muscae TaxID=2509004 RepID=A0A563DHG4_9FLAO|nr:phosphoenolpyruvate carboxylase [Apibacter muscae]TWP29461.1 phosphoenolpyruvate carboxylase [Apibacter muscae]TWP30133.1 phosphoenolpyruvate carboxylase [Apibacter muscae]